MATTISGDKLTSGLTVMDLKFTLQDDFLWNYRAKCVRVVDGDTVDVVIDLGLHTYKKERVRILDLNTPEMYGVKKDTDEYRAGLAAKEALEKLILDKEVIIETIKDRSGKYGRLLANIWIPQNGDMINITLWMIDKGHDK